MPENLNKTDNLLASFNRCFQFSKERLTQIGDGSIGGKAHGLMLLNSILYKHFPEHLIENCSVTIPRLVVLSVSVFDLFMERNHLYNIVEEEYSDERLLHHFIHADFPAEYVGDIWDMVSHLNTPMAIRSSSLLEDSLETPFAGVYATKMTPNNQPDAETRFHKLIEAVKFVYASTFFSNARAYARATGNDIKNEKMAVILQEVAGLRHGNRFYPNFSGVLRSYNPYPFGRAKPENGIVSLALGLGKTIVDGGLSWSFSPAFPRVNPPSGSVRELIKITQSRFWAINMNKQSEYNPLQETEYLCNKDLAAAEYDNVLKEIASTYDSASDQIRMGTAIHGPRILNFAPVLHFDDIPLIKILKTITPFCEEAWDAPVEIEFAYTIAPNKKYSFHLLQVRAMAREDQNLTISLETVDDEKKLAVSHHVLGSGTLDNITDVVYVKPESFDFKDTEKIATEIENINKVLSNKNRSYILIGFGRWGSSDPWLGIPVQWAHISGARLIVEATHPNRPVDLSHGSHFFHNILNLGVFYFQIRDKDSEWIDWNWLSNQPPVSESSFIRHIHLACPLQAVISAKERIGIIIR